MSQVMNTPNGPLLCSRINAGSAERGDMLVSDDGQRVLRLIDMHRNYHTRHVILRVTGAEPWRALRVNEPVWRAVGARAAGHIA